MKVKNLTNNTVYADDIDLYIPFDNKEIEIPSLVPTLTKDEIQFLLDGNKPTKEIVKKARDFAIQRMREGKSPFAQEGEQGRLPQ